MEFDWHYLILAGLIISALGHLSRIISIITNVSKGKEDEENS